MLAIQPQELSRDRILAYYKAKNYVFFDGGNYDLNIIGVRNRVPKVNAFDDVLMCLYRENGSWRQQCWAATTDPGLYWLENPMNVSGTAILCPGQYRKSHTVGIHKTYSALVQVGNLTVWRDGNRNSLIDFDKTKTYTAGDFGINIHRSSLNVGGASEVGMYSAGCTVVQDPKDFDAFMSLVFKAASIWGNLFSYTLLEQADLENVVPRLG